MSKGTDVASWHLVVCRFYRYVLEPSLQFAEDGRCVIEMKLIFYIVSCNNSREILLVLMGVRLLSLLICQKHLFSL